jgi:hypothetical protein
VHHLSYAPLVSFLLIRRRCLLCKPGTCQQHWFGIHGECSDRFIARTTLNVAMIVSFGLSGLPRVANPVLHKASHFRISHANLINAIWKPFVSTSVEAVHSQGVIEISSPSGGVQLPQIADLAQLILTR